MGRHAGDPCVRKRARPVVIEVARIHDPHGLFGEPADPGPVITLHGDEPSLGDHEGNERDHAAGRSFLIRPREQVIGVLQVAFEHGRHALGVEHCGAIRAGGIRLRNAC
jgi:hypothetical protein